ncbi:MAG: RNA polymerase sigma factor [Rhodocyclaceae bacterium]|nr:RNA polymerase sigma factor [Rhodocyclaceae bacterium]
MPSRPDLDRFLRAVERRAFRHAMYALRDEEAALDAVQEAMTKLCVRYASRPAGEWPMLFQRILQNVTRDALRRRKVRDTWIVLWSKLGLGGDDPHEDAPDPLDALVAADDCNEDESPHRRAEQAQLLAILEREIARLPQRQREAFLMRYWEELDTAETAAAMGCSEGSVKTHCSRATRTLADALRARGIEP